MTTLISILAVYSSIVGLIYLVASRLQDIISENVRTLMSSQLKLLRLSYITQNWFIIVISTIDRVLGFKQRKTIWRPRYTNSFIYSGCYVTLISFITLPNNVSPFRGATAAERILVALIWYFFITPPLFISCAFIDFISFAKTRTLIYLSQFRSLFIKILYYVLDFAVSLLLTLLIASIVWMIAELWRGVTLNVSALDRWTTEIVERGRLHFGTYMFFYDWYNAGNYPVVTFFIWGLLSSIGISLI
jgi:hypothetical protein